ncbi:MAG: sugar nucleotide-binding protein, partial [Verrucomicrobiota bacterium]|nr:sugar nucleotide-binding protein [Verrucomicrobiota bacterium]
MSDLLTVSTLPERQALSKGPIWVTGAGGLIGHHVVKQSPGNRQVIGWLRHDLDLLDFEAVERQFKDRRPAAIIHCAAMSKSPQCEAQPKEAQAINVDATRHLAQLAHSIPLIFL